ncbi:MAG TPA: tetratricopeptide repeat protein [Nitrospiria bacterium]|nr:tetratricopeptide repeat protein [Nitrospiria bacterium]
MESIFKNPGRWVKTHTPFFEIGSSARSAFVRFLVVCLTLASTVSSGRPETSALSLEDQIARAQSELALIKTEIIHRYQSNTAELEPSDPSAVRSSHPETRNIVAEGELSGDGASQSMEARLREIAVLIKRLETGGDSSLLFNEVGPPSTDEIRLLLADRLLQANLTSQAEQVLNNVVVQTRRAPIAAEAWFRLEKLYYRKGDYPRALGAFFKIPMDKTFPWRQEATYLAGNSDLYLKEYLKAIDLLGNVGEGSEYYPFAVYSSGLAYLNLGDAWSSTQLQFQKLTALNPGEDSVLRELINKTRVTLGFFFIDQKRYSEAMAVFEAIPSESRYWVQARFGLGKVFMGIGDCVKAIVVYNDLIDQAPTHPYALESRLQIGACYSKLSAYHRAVGSYQEALKAYSERSEGLKKLTQQIQATGVESWLFASGVEKTETGFDLEPGFAELVDMYTDWLRLHKEIAEPFQGDKNHAPRETERGSLADDKSLQMKMEDVHEDLIRLLRASATRHLSFQLARIDGLALRANMGIAKNMTFMQDHETAP